MIVKIGNLFDSKCSTIVNTVNCVGVMGKGIALEFKKRYPEMFMEYVLKCDRGEVKPGLPYVYQNDIVSILNFPTKDDWRSSSRLSYILDGLDWFAENYEKFGIKSIAFPPLGCGNGGLSWSVVGPIMYHKLSRLPIDVEIYAPFGTREEELSTDFLVKEVPDNAEGEINISKMNPKWYLILQVVKELNERKYTLTVGRTIYQKICFVLTRNGVNTGFAFSKGSYGPFSARVKDSITAFANANLIVEKKLGRMIALRVSDSFKLPQEGYTPAEMEAVRKTVDLFGRMKSTEQAEMMATVLFSYDRLKEKDQIVSDKDVYDYVLKWKSHWAPDREFDLCETIQNAAMLSLIDIKCSGELMDTMLV